MPERHTAMAFSGKILREQKNEHYKYNLGENEDLAFSNSKTPPGWNGENVSWRVWNRRIARWLLTTEIVKERKGATIAGRLFGAPVRKCERLKDELLAKPDGAQYVLKEMETFKEFAADQAYVDIKAFTTRCRHKGESLRDFIVDWENLRATAEDHDFNFGGGLDAFFMIDAAGMHLTDITIMLHARITRRRDGLHEGEAVPPQGESGRTHSHRLGGGDAERALGDGARRRVRRV